MAVFLHQNTFKWRDEEEKKSFDKLKTKKNDENIYKACDRQKKIIEEEKLKN